MYADYRSSFESVMSLSAKTVLVTGSSRGLGLEFVRQISKLPSAPEILIATCRDPSTAVELQAIAKSNPSVKVVKMDVSKDEEIRACFKQVSDLLGDRGLNLLISNAGIVAYAGQVRDVTRESMQNHFNTNVTGPVIVSQTFLPLLQAASRRTQPGELSASRSAIVMLSTIMSSLTVTHDEKEASPSYLHYRCSKTALNMATVLMARELKDDGVLVFALHPGWVRTDMGTSQAPLSPEESIRDCLQVIGKAGEDNHGTIVDFKGQTLQY